MADLATAVVTYLLLAELLARFGDDDRQQFFPKESVWYSYHLDIGNPGMAQQHLLDFSRKEVFATTNDHVFEPTNNIDVPTRIHRCQVASMQPPTLVNRLGGLLGQLV